MKRCNKCKETKPTSEFSRSTAKPDGFQAYCKDCMKLSSAKHYAKHKDKIIQTVRNRQKQIPEQIKAYQQIYEPKYRRRMREERPADYDSFRIRMRAYRKENYKRVKDAILAILGDRCVRCGYSDRRALHIDHMNGGGNAERRSYTSISYYQHILNVGCQGYQTLCANCHIIKHCEEREG